ncbi:hypothetical protein ACSSV5_000418 [Psychroflexus sp. MBR-150]|jgi:hypothetical protein
MGSLAISNKILDKYYGYLKNLDVNSKKKINQKVNKLIRS